MKIVSFVICFGWAMAFHSVVEAKIHILSALGIPVPFVYKIWPIIALGVYFCILKFGFYKKCTTKMQLIVGWGIRMVCVGLVCSMAYIGIGLICAKSLESVRISKQILEQMNWQAFQANLDFKVVCVDNSDGTQIYFGTAVGRRQMVNAALIKLVRSS